MLMQNHPHRHECRYTRKQIQKNYSHSDHSPEPSKSGFRRRPFLIRIGPAYEVIHYTQCNATYLNIHNGEQPKIGINVSVPANPLLYPCIFPTYIYLHTKTHICFRQTFPPDHPCASDQQKRIDKLKIFAFFFPGCLLNHT